MQFRVAVGSVVTVVGVCAIVFAKVSVPAQNQSDATVQQSGSASGFIKDFPLSTTAALKMNIEVLKKESAAQKREIEKLKNDLAATNTRLKQSMTQPPGYATTYITKLNWNRVPGNTLLKVWMRE